MALLADAQGQLTLEIGFKSPLIPIRLWTGEDNLIYNGNTFIPGKLMDIGETQIAISPPQSYPYFAMALTQDGDRMRFFNNDPGPLITTIEFLWRIREGLNWQSAFKIEGRLSDAVFTPSDSLFTVNIEPILYDVNHGVTEGWNNASQRRRNSDDAGMEYVNKLNQNIRWPP